MRALLAAAMLCLCAAAAHAESGITSVYGGRDGYCGKLARSASPAWRASPSNNSAGIGRATATSGFSERCGTVMQHTFAIVWGALMLAGLLAVSAPRCAYWFATKK